MQFPFKVIGHRDFDVVGFGTNAVDFLIEVPEYPAYSSKIEINQYTQAAGGEVATTMVGLQRLGMRTAYVGRFGDDPAGEFGLTTLRDEGVNTAYSEQIKDARTQIAFIVIDARTGERTVIWKRDEKLQYTEQEAPVELPARASVLHMTPHDVRAATAMAAAANQCGTIVSIDVDNVFNGIEKLLPLVDVLIASAEFPERLLGLNNYETALPEMASRFGCGVCGVTLGPEGSLLYSARQFVRTKGVAVPGGCRDTTGAGDAYRVGMIYGLLRSNSIEESAVFANAVAALKCRSVGARTALPTEHELKEFSSTMAQAR